MSNANKSWVAFPQFLYLNKTPLKYQDALIYVTIRSFLNSKTGDCFPSLETIADKAGVGRTFVCKSLKRLKVSGLITSQTRKVGTDRNSPNQYSFSKFKLFEQIPVQIFDCKDLSCPEKAMLICIRQFFKFDPLMTTNSIKTMATELGVTPKMMYTQLNGLLKKEYLMKVARRLKNGDKLNSKYVMTSRLPWKTYEVRIIGEVAPTIRKLSIG